MPAPQEKHEDGGVGEENDDEVAMLDPNDAEEEIIDDEDAAMDSGGEDTDGEMIEIDIQNDSSGHFIKHQDSIFSIAQHPKYHNIVATGGSEGEDLGGIGYIFDSTPEPTPVLPESYRSAPLEDTGKNPIEPIFKLEGHTDSINALAFTLPKGDFLISGGLDGKLRAYAGNKEGLSWKFLAEVQEVEEINWLATCPDPASPNTFALGANDGSVWVYMIDTTSKDAPLHILQSFFLHTESCTAGSWSVDGKILATVSEDGSLYVWDVFGEAAAAGLTQEGGQTIVGLTSQDQRFAVEGGLYSVAIAPNGSFVVVGGAGGSIKVVGLPRLGSESSGSAPAGRAGAGAESKVKGAKQAGSKGTASSASAGQAGQILADLQAQTGGIESLAFTPPPLTLLAAGSVDGSIALFDTAHRFAVRRHIKDAHEELAVVKVEFVNNSRTGGWLLTSCGMDGVVRRWDTRGGTSTTSGLVGEWKGHMVNEERGGVLGFVQGSGERIVTAGDEGVSLVFDAPIA